MAFLTDNCTLRIYNSELINSCLPFDCGNKDLNDYFINDAINYNSELLGKSYCFVLDSDPSIIVCAFTLSNDSIKTNHLPNARKKKLNVSIPRAKQMRTYPAVLIGRLGIAMPFRNVESELKRTSHQLMDFIKSWFVDNSYKTGCRFIVVDAYNAERPLKFYKSNGFNQIFSTEEQEKEYTGLLIENELVTRLMYFDLILLSPLYN